MTLASIATARTLATAAATPAPAGGTGPAQVQPREDWWEVGGQRFDSTADLVSRFKPGAGDPPEAVYCFRNQPDLTPRERALNTVAGGVLGAAIGAGVVGGAVLALNLVAGIGTILTAGMFGSPNFLGVAVPAAVGAAAGAGVGLFVTGKDAASSADPGNTALAGNLMVQNRPDGDHLMFFRGGDVRNGVDLTEYAKAPTPPARPDVPARPWIQDSLKGAALGAALAPGSLIPVVGLLAGVGVGVHAGAKASGDRFYGAIFGGAAGAAATAGIFVSLSKFGWQGLAAAAGTLAVTGAVLGPVLLPRMREQAAEEALFAGQWWNRSQEQAA